MKGRESHHIFLWKLGTTVYYSPSLITVVKDAFIFLLMMLLYHIISWFHYIISVNIIEIENDNLQHICIIIFYNECQKIS